MSAGGYFCLELRCDQKEGCDRAEDFVYPSKMEAKEAARSAGWKINRWGKAICPEHRKDQ